MINTNWLCVFLVESGNVECLAVLFQGDGSAITISPINIHLCGRDCRLMPQPDHPYGTVYAHVWSHMWMRVLKTAGVTVTT